MIDVIKDIIKQDYPIILTCGLFFIVGVGIGGAVSDMLWRERKDDTKK